MLKTRYIKIQVTDLDNDRYFISAFDENDRNYAPSTWQYLLFNYHSESFYGTMTENAKIDGTHGVILNGWQLATLFAHDQFNRMIEWDWDDTGQLCLASAHTIYDAVTQMEWMPDFASWEQDEFRWSLPDRVLDEFAPEFWERENVLNFMKKWFNHSLNDYLNQNKELKAKFGEKLQTLTESTIAPRQLASFFDEESFRIWMGIIDNPVPFTLGLKLEEPAEISDFWTLELFLRDKNNPNLVVDFHNEDNFPTYWSPHLDGIKQEQQRWISLFPWLAGNKGLTDKLTEEEAWIFLTEASETLLALGVDILLPSWWIAMKNANLKVKAKVKGTTGSHRQSFVGLQAVLDYDWRFSMNGVDLSEEEFNQLVEEKRKLVYIRGRWIKLDPAFIHQIQELMKKAEQEGLTVRDVIEQELFKEEDAEIDDLDDPRTFGKIQIELNRNWKSMIKGLRDLKQLPLEDVPEGFHGNLRPYQQLGMSWLLFLRQYGFGATLSR